MLWIETLEEMEKKREKELEEALKKEQEKEKVTIELTKEQLGHIFQTMKYKDGVKG